MNVHDHKRNDESARASWSGACHTRDSCQISTLLLTHVMLLAPTDACRYPLEQHMTRLQGDQSCTLTLTRGSRHQKPNIATQSPGGRVFKSEQRSDGANVGICEAQPGGRWGRVCVNMCGGGGGGGTCVVAPPRCSPSAYARWASAPAPSVS